MDRGLPEKVSIATAAQWSGVSRRTIERWVKRGLLSSEPDELDRRQALVSLHQLGKLLEAKGDVSGSAPTLPPIPKPPSVPDPNQDTIDACLRQVSEHEVFLSNQLFPIEVLSPGPIHPNSPLRLTLDSLSQASRGKREATPVVILRQIDDVLSAIFAAADRRAFAVPDEFWSEPLGSMLALAKLQALTVRGGGVVDLEVEAEELEVRPETLTFLLPILRDRYGVEYVRDPRTGHVMLEKPTWHEWRWANRAGRPETTSLWNKATDDGLIPLLRRLASTASTYATSVKQFLQFEDGPLPTVGNLIKVAELIAVPTILWSELETVIANAESMLVADRG